MVRSKRVSRSRQASSELVDPFENSKAFFTAAAKTLGYGEDEIRYLNEPTNVLEVRFRAVGTRFTGWRIRFNPTGEVSKGGIRVAYPLPRTHILSLAQEMGAKVKVMNLPFGGGKSGFACEGWKGFSKQRKCAVMRACARAVHRELGPMVDTAAGDVGTTDSKLMYEIADESRMVLQDYANAALSGRDVRRARHTFRAEDAIPFIQRNYGIKVEGDRDLLDRIAGDEEFAYLIASPVVTAKPTDKGGLQIRDEATGRGTAVCVMEAAKESYLKGAWKLSDEVTAADRKKLDDNQDLLAKNTWELPSDAERRTMDELYAILLKGKRVVVEGFGNAGQWSAKHLSDRGAKVVAVSDTSGVVVKEDGLPVDTLIGHKNSGKPIAEFSETGTKIEPAGRGIYKIKADVYVPAALAESVRREDAERIAAIATDTGSDVIIAESANNPMTTKANEVLARMPQQKPHVRRVPDILANAMGVTSSIGECAHNYLAILRAGVPLTPEYEAHINNTLTNLDPKGDVLRRDVAEPGYEQWGRLLDDRMRKAYKNARLMANEHNVDLATGTWLMAVKRIVEGVRAKN